MQRHFTLASQTLSLDTEDISLCGRLNNLGTLYIVCKYQDPPFYVVTVYQEI